MKIFNSIDEFAASGKSKNVVTTGTFDGVHLGHHAILDKVSDIAKDKKAESVLLTFHPHPRQVLFPAPYPPKGEQGGLFFLSTLSERQELLDKAGIQNLIIHPFTKELSQVSAFDYVKDILVGKLKTETLVIGHDHRFGHNREGSIKELIEWGPQFGFNVEEMAPISSQWPVVSGQSLLSTNHQPLSTTVISSSKIRKAIQGDDLQTANKYLGYHFFIHAKVVHGMKLGGKELGYPTANLEIDFPDKIVPADGIYAVYVYVSSQSSVVSGQSLLTTDNGPLTTGIYKGMMSIGSNPTIEGKGRSMEVHIFHFHKDIYGETIKVAFVKKIRNEEKFNSMEELKARLDEDREVCEGIL